MKKQLLTVVIVWIIWFMLTLTIGCTPPQRTGEAVWTKDGVMVTTSHPALFELTDGDRVVKMDSLGQSSWSDFIKAAGQILTLGILAD